MKNSLKKLAIIIFVPPIVGLIFLVALMVAFTFSYPAYSDFFGISASTLILIVGMIIFVPSLALVPPLFFWLVIEVIMRKTSWLQVRRRFISFCVIYGVLSGYFIMFFFPISKYNMEEITMLYMVMGGFVGWAYGHFLHPLYSKKTDK